MLRMKEAGWAKTRRRPVGEEAFPPLRFGVKYRNPFSTKGHLPDYDGQTAVCGFPLVLDEQWYIEAGWEEYFGFAFYLQEDTRSTEACSPCKTRWSSEAEAIRFRKEQEAKVEEKYQSPYDADLRSTVGEVVEAATAATRRVAKFWAQKEGWVIVDEQSTR